MSNTCKIALMTAAAATLAALAGAPAVYAHGDKAQTSGSTMHGGSSHMMDMMGPMTTMMESCNKMMQDMTPSPGTERIMQDMTPSQGAEKPKAKSSAEKSQ